MACLYSLDPSPTVPTVTSRIPPPAVILPSTAPLAELCEALALLALGVLGFAGCYLLLRLLPAPPLAQS